MSTQVTVARKPLAFLCHPYHRGGVTRWMVDAASNWVDRGCDCWFVAPYPRQAFLSGAARPTMVELVEAVGHGSRPRLVAPSVGSEFEFGTAGYRARVYARALQEGVPPGVPVIVSDDSSTWRAVELLGGRNPLIGVLHADDASYYALAARFHKSASAIVAVSHRVSSRAHATVGAWAARTEVIPCGISLPRLPPVGERESGMTRLVWVGRISEAQKRVSDLVAIALALDGAGHRFSLDIIGDGENAGELRADVRDAGLHGRVAFHGWLPQDRVVAMLGRSDIMVLPSNFEGMPVAAMEALACGCAVVGSDSCGLEEYADHDGVRNVLWIYPRGDISRAATAIAEAARTSPEERRPAARRFAAKEFAIDICMDRYDAMLGRLAVVPMRGGGVAFWYPSDVTSALVAGLRRGTTWIRSRLSPRARTPTPTVAPPVP